MVRTTGDQCRLARCAVVGEGAGREVGGRQKGL